MQSKRCDRALGGRARGSEAIGKVKDLVVDSPGRQVLGFVISGSLFRSAKVAPWAGVRAIGPDAIVLGSASDIVKAGGRPRHQSRARQRSEHPGSEAANDGGQRTGQDRRLPVRRAPGPCSATNWPEACSGAIRSCLPRCRWNWVKT